MVIVLLSFNFLLMILMPILMGRWIRRRRGAGWGLFGIGAVTFVLSQVGHIPFNWLILQKLEWITGENLIVLTLFLGISSGAFEEVARYLAYRFWAREARSWGRGLMLGAGHGGIEAIFLGVIGLLNLTVLLGLDNGYFQGLLASVPEDQLYLVDNQISALFDVPPMLALLGAVERLFALLLHLSASLLVMQVFVRKQLRWLGASVGWHAVFNGVAVYVATVWGAVPAELALGLLSLVSLGLIFWLRTPEPIIEPPEPLPELQPLAPLAQSYESLDRSKYTG